MIKRLLFILVFGGLMLIPSYLFAQNTLITRVPNNPIQKPGYIKNAVIVAEPHGAYTEQSLYLEYTDNMAFPGFNSVEIIHRFELPEGAVINDLWLWIGNDVMKGLILDTWTARSIYDSIVAMKRDPAFLTKRGSQYELKIYPLISGQTRKIKMNIIIPTRWDSANAYAELPLKYFKASGGTTLPAELMFRQRVAQWGTPGIPEIPDAVFNPLADTMGYIYQRYSVQDLKALNSFRIKYGTSFSSGAFFDNNNLPDKGNFFQFGFIPWQVMELDSFQRSPVKMAIGIDLSSDFSKNYLTLFPKLKTTIKAALANQDQFRLFVSGAGQVRELTTNWEQYIPQQIDTLIDRFINSSFGDSVAVRSRARVIYGDYYASQIWSFNNINQLADITNFNRLPYALNDITKSNVTAAYKHGYEHVLTDLEAQQIRQRLDSLFLAGGRFLTYYDRNRISREKLAKYYIPSLGIDSNTGGAVTLYRTENGNIRTGFPAVHDRNGGYFFSFNDTTVRKELVDINGKPMVISKRLGNGGLLVVTGIWPFNDDESLRKMMAIPMLGLNTSAMQIDYQLKDLLYTLRNAALGDTTTALLVFSNSDSLVNSVGTSDWIDNFLLPITTERLNVRSVNLLDGSDVIPQSYEIDDKKYYGSGYLMQKLAQRTYGVHFETHLTDWTTINNLLTPSNKPLVDSLNLYFTFDGPNDSLLSINPVNNFLFNPDQPVIYMGKMDVTSAITANITARFMGRSQIFHKSLEFTPAFDTTLKINIIPTMIGNEELKYMFSNTPSDTTGIVSRAVEHNLITDYTALLCLEPNDTILPLINPFDESGLVPVELTAFFTRYDSGSVVLEWRTATEVNNAGFRIERIVNGSVYELGFIPGQGTTTIPYVYTLRDAEVTAFTNGSIRYRLYQVDMDGSQLLLDEIEADPAGIPTIYELAQNYPNPFNPETTIRFSIPEDTRITLHIYNILGQHVRTLMAEEVKAGFYKVPWNGTNDSGFKVADGVYMYVLESSTFRSVKKMILIK